MNDVNDFRFTVREGHQIRRGEGLGIDLVIGRVDVSDAKYAPGVCFPVNQPPPTLRLAWKWRRGVDNDEFGLSHRDTVDGNVADVPFVLREYQHGGFNCTK